MWVCAHACVCTQATYRTTRWIHRCIKAHSRLVTTHTHTHTYKIVDIYTQTHVICLHCWPLTHVRAASPRCVASVHMSRPPHSTQRLDAFLCPLPFWPVYMLLRPCFLPVCRFDAPAGVCFCVCVCVCVTGPQSRVCLVSFKVV